MNPTKMKEVRNGRIYSTETAILIADDNYFDGQNFERNGRNSFLYRTEKGNYFLITCSMWQGEEDSLEAVEEEEALCLYEGLREKHEGPEIAFPNRVFETA